MQHKQSKQRFFNASFVCLLMLVSKLVFAQPSFTPDNFTRTIFIDTSLTKPCLSYDVKTRRCGKGNKQAIKKLSQSQKLAKAGVLFLIREGQYREALHIKNSGNANAYIGYSAYQNEQVVLLDSNSVDNHEVYGAIWFDQSRYVWVNGLTVKGSVGFGRLLNAHFNIFSNNQFLGSTFWKEGKGASKRGGLYVAFSHHNKIVNNHFYQGTDSLSLVHSNYNLVQGNKMDLAGHDIWNIKCGSFNVIRANEFSNKNQKIGAILDCEIGTMSWHGNGEFAQQKAVVDNTKHNIVEHNIFRDAVRYYSTSGGNGIQYAGQNGIIRFNQFYRTNAGLGMTAYKSEAMYNYDNRVYHNTFHDNWCAAISIGGEIKKHRNNEFVNNIIWNNQGVTKNQCSGESAKQILFSRMTGNNWFFNNNIASSKGEQVIGVWGKDKNYSIYDYEGSYLPVQFDKNRAENPLFIDEENNNYQLKNNSPMIDKGAFMTVIISAAGVGKQLQVKDATFFFDGYGIKGLQGDLIQIQGQTKTARIIQIDYQTNALTLDASLTWQEGDLVTFAYQGKAPDIGAFEFSK